MKTLLLLLFLPFLVLADEQGGISLGATRVIFPSDAKSVSLPVNNSSRSSVFLLRSWVSPYHENDKTSAPFIITPPLYRLDSENTIQLRINATRNDTLPQDRESVFMVNVMAIPPEKKDNLPSEGSLIRIAVNNRIKLFYRPQSLNNQQQVNDAYSTLQVVKSSGFITVKNPSPYYITLGKVFINGKENRDKGADLMMPPMGGEVKLPVSDKTGRFTYQVINDFGGMSPEITLNF
ncbi:molecular chaperone [Salmonella enterica]|uniref:Molecular chaperone n=2 Tax=Salmonella enterica TaxID=28901 RepID=A0A626YSS5_SALER|nr:molecular chaperone [Salmonella enterica]EBP4002250.1 molecular chaperone [Salmonella enterica subsp. enterica]EBW4116940.1 molecular chaperone [Salmonella enterica subsp. enterica serovar Oranienburg]ECG1308593.1 molecular chaperone [Salmonella enterica subsp. diarizonae]EED8464474.1 molecular chaperone [Salmonella enterica subsp. diarizonae serovar 61:i:z53]EIG1170698.1 molecular chaperone [Salmonella enterica subsp. diarizonae serovar 48:k:z53]